MEIIKNFGLNPILLLAQVINFLIVLLLLKKFLYKPVLDTLRKRQIVIKEGLKHADDARIKLEKVIIEEKNILRQAQLQSKKIIEDAKEDAIEITKRMNEEARKQTEKLLNDTKEQVAKESKDAERKLALNVSGLAITILKKTMKDFFSPKDQEKIILNAMKKIKRYN